MVCLCSQEFLGTREMSWLDVWGPRAGRERWEKGLMYLYGFLIWKLNIISLIFLICNSGSNWLIKKIWGVTKEISW